MRKLLVAALAMAPMFASATVVNSKHDLTYTSNSVYVTGQASYVTACSFCHSPHKALTTRGLWVRGEPTAAEFVSPTTTLGNSLAQTTSALFNSKQCLSCHDGSIAVNQVVQYPLAADGSGPTATGAVTQTLGTLSGDISAGAGYLNSLEGTHPVSVPYPPAGAVAGTYYTVKVGGCKAGIAFCTTAPVNGDSVSLKNQLNGTYTVECQSCHEPHEWGTGNFLRANTSSGGRCIGCHNK